MMKRKEFDNVLDECLERIIAGGETLEQCLASYPDQADELRPLLETALVTKGALAIKPRPEFRDRARHQMRMALQEMEPEKERRRFSLFSWQPRWATALIAVLVFLMAGSGTVAAASNSMPDQPLYPVKMATERVRLALTLSPLGKAELYTSLAEKRVTEIINMAEKGKPEQVERTARKLNIHLERIASLTLPAGEEGGMMMAPPAQESPLPEAAMEVPEEEAGVMEEPAPPATEKARGVPGREEGEPGEGPELDRRARLTETVIRNIAEHRAKLRAALDRAPEAARPALRRAIERSDSKYQHLLEILMARDRD